MKKVIILNDDNQENILDELFEMREQTIEQDTEERKKFIRDNNLKEITHDDIIEEFDKIPNLDPNTKERILNKLDKMLDNRLKINSYDCKRYYGQGICDVFNMMFCMK